ncbi:uncharacterized protein LTR77_008918 [Saxophila tyrrhenica]|uniref:Protein kinase domain-containing protein n=1 Tax=Saxophila tyrrhenica TaxID=1690608 RepID=A0AAV9P2U4_9PEZI|nr:hypothetical protein LTR77_008918 [Saxophila tyrrhenica]
MPVRPQYAAQSRAHFRETHEEVSFLSEGSNGECFLAIKASDVDEILEDYAVDESMDVLIKRLRDSLVVAKFYKPRRDNLDKQDVQDEINFLRSLPANRPEVTSLVDYSLGEEAQWFTMKYVPGSTLCNLVRDCHKDLSTGLQWHLALGICTRTLKRYGDLHSANLLIRPASSLWGLEIVLADFGRAETQPDTRIREDDFRTLRNDDYQWLGVLMESILIANKVGKGYRYCWHEGVNPDCEICLDKARLPTLSTSEKLLVKWAKKFRTLEVSNDDDLLELLKEFAEVAKTQEALHGTRLNPRVEEYLEGQGLSENEILEIVGM